jgi:hypothetical protein
LTEMVAWSSEARFNFVHLFVCAWTGAPRTRTDCCCGRPNEPR